MRSRGPTIENLLLQLLQKGSLTAVELIQRIRTERLNTTKQGVYRVLRKLRGEERVVIHGKSVSLNLQWIKRMGEFFSLAQFRYSARSGPDSFLNIGAKDRIVYFFKNLNLLDAFASHVLHMLDAVVDPAEPLFVYNPHEWFAYARAEAEEMLISTFGESKRAVLVTSAYDDPLDRELKKRFRSDLLQYHITHKPIADKSNYYFVILGPYLIEILIDEAIHDAIDRFYKETAIFDEKAKAELLAIVSRPGRSKLTISKRKSRIGRYIKLLSKKFYIPAAASSAAS